MQFHDFEFFEQFYTIFSVHSTSEKVYAIFGGHTPVSYTHLDVYKRQPVIYLKGNTGFQMSEMVYVGEEHLVGEVIGLTRDTTTIQVFEETTGLKPGAAVEATGDAISVLLGPGILNNCLLYTSRCV